MKSYLITDPLYYTNNPDKFKTRLIKALKEYTPNIACFRDKISSNYEELAQVFVEICETYKVETILLNENYLLAKKLKAHGVHLTSKQFDKIKEVKDYGLFTITSCHNLKEIEIAKEANVNAITYSPIFFTPNKGREKGIDDLKQVISLYKDLDIIALGGIIDKTHVKQIQQAKAYGFASIRYFLK
jgi:thiamine-phosphate pyrophosphorylase